MTALYLSLASGALSFFALGFSLATYLSLT